MSEPANVAEICNMYYSSIAQYKQEYEDLYTADFVRLIKQCRIV